MPAKIAPGLLSWATGLDDKTVEQAARSASLPFIFGHVALMPDAHFGYGSTVGSVIPTKGAIVPSAVGVDIGCGMIAGLTNLTAGDLPDDLGALHAGIAQRVPAGVGRGHDVVATDSALFDPMRKPHHWNDRLSKKAREQLGTLGSGNHFVEVCLDESDRVWVVLHSGSRGVGNEIAKFHIDGAKALMQRYFIDLPDPDLAYLVEGTPEFSNYVWDMQWAQNYAMENRELMLAAVMEALRIEFLGRPQLPSLIERINCHHNYTDREHHHGQNVWVTRKGAVRARVGDRGVIPGSMGAASYIVSGLGSKASFDSCSHGAGRRLGRKQAERTLTTESLFEAMEGKVWNRDAALLDEHPDAYKDIDEVMANQADLVTIERTLHQVLNYKGL